METDIARPDPMTPFPKDPEYEKLASEIKEYRLPYKLL